MAYENAYAALVNDQNVVQKVIVIPYCNDNDHDVTAYCNSIGLPGRWLDCSFTGSRRGIYPGLGCIYDPAADEFIAPEIPE